MKLSTCTIISIATCIATQVVEADLLGRAPTEPGGDTFQAYYDSVLDVTWLANASLPKIESFGLDGDSPFPHGQMSWYTANEYLRRMNESAYLGVTTWRLPKEIPLDGIAFDLAYSTDGTTDFGQGVPHGWVNAGGEPVSELGHMYFVNLAFSGTYELEKYPGSDGVLSGTAPIIGLDDGRYLTSTTWPEDDRFVWAFDMLYGLRTFNGKGGPDGVALAFVWPIADGDVFFDYAAATPVPVPIPAPFTLLLLSPALALIGLLRLRKHAGR